MAALHCSRHDGDAGIVVGRVHDAEGVGLRLPAIGIERAGVRLLGIVEDLVDGDDFARLGTAEKLVVVIAPPRRDRGAEYAPCMVRIAARARHDVEDAHLQHIAGLGILHRDRTGADVHAESFPGAATEHARVHRTSAATIDVLPVPRPAEHAFSTGIARDHHLGRVGGVLRQRLDGDGVARGDLDLRRQRAAEIAPMDATGLDREMVVPAFRGRPRLSAGTPNGAACLDARMHAELRQRLLRPAALTGNAVLQGRALRLLLAEFARRQTKAVTEGAAEMCGIAKAVGVGDLRNRAMGFRGVGQISPGTLEAAFADVMGEIVADRLEQLLQVALGNPLGLRDARRHQFGIVEPPLDGLADPMQQRGLRRTRSGIGRRGRQLMRERQEQVNERLRDRIPFVIAQRVERARGRVEQTREHIGKAAGRNHARFAEPRLAREASVQRFRGHRQHDGPHVTLEHDAPVPAPRQQHEMADRNDAVAAGASEHHAVLDRHQRDRKVFIRLRKRCDALRASGHSRQRDTCSVAMRCGCMSVKEGMAGRRSQADRRQHVPPGFGAVVLRVGLARERPEAHRINPDCR
ncbi:hypothetical protein ABIF44_000875 [Bradyrhizobium japonicum]